MIKPSQEDLITLGLGVAEGSLNKDAMKNFIEKNK